MTTRLKPPDDEQSSLPVGDAPVPQPRMRVTPEALPLPALRRITLGSLPVLLIVLVWWLATAYVLPDSRVYPSPLDATLAAWDIITGQDVEPFGPVLPHVLATLARALTAFVISSSVGLILGILAGRSERLFDVLSNLMWTGMAVPVIVWVMIFAVAFGLGNAVPIAALTVLLTPMVYLNVAEGMKALPNEVLEMADSYKINRRDRLVSIYLPHVWPYFFGGMRICFAGTVRVVLVAEIIGLTLGIGYLVLYASGFQDMAPVVAWGILLMAFGVLVDVFIFGALERRMMKWR